MSDSGDLQRAELPRHSLPGIEITALPVEGKPGPYSPNRRSQSAERAALTDASIEVASDGLEIRL